MDGDLLATTGSDNEGVDNAKYFHQSFSGGDNSTEGEDEEESIAEETPKPEEPVRKIDLEKETAKKRGDRKGKQPVRPVGFQDMMSSITRAGQRETVPRNEKVGVPTAVTFGRGKNNIPHGLRFNAVDNDKAGQDVGTHKDQPSHEDGEPDEIPDADERNKNEEPAVPDRVPNRRRSSSSSSGSSSSSNSTSSAGGSPDNARRRRRRRSRSERRHSRRRNRRKEPRAEREERKAMARQKATPPSVYDGKADLLVFDKWTYEVNNWVRQSKYRDVTALRSLVSYVSGKRVSFSWIT